MSNRYEWATEEIYDGIESWQKEFDSVKDKLNFDEYRGKLGTADGFLSCMKAQEKVVRVIEKLSVYAMMKHDEDTRNAVYDSLSSKVTALGVKLGESTAFIMPELTALPESTLNALAKNPELKEYDYFLNGVIKEKAHVLSENEERLLAMTGDAFSSFRDIFTKIDNADIKFGKIKDGNTVISLSHGTYSVLLHGENRELRKKAYKKYYSAYRSLINAISATYYGNVKKGVFYAKARKFPSALDAALFNEDVPRMVYENLLSTVNDALPTMHEYVAERKRLLGYDPDYSFADGIKLAIEWYKENL